LKEANQSFDWLFSNIFTHLKAFSDHILILIEHIFFTKKYIFLKIIEQPKYAKKTL